MKEGVTKDVLSQLLNQYHFQVHLKRHCDLSGNWRLPHVRSDINEIYWHAVYSQPISLHLPNRSAITIPADSVIFLPQHSAHCLQPINKIGEQKIICGVIELPRDLAIFFGQLPEVLCLSSIADVDVAYIGTHQKKHQQTAVLYATFLKSCMAVLNQEHPCEYWGSHTLATQLIQAIFVLVLRQTLTQQYNAQDFTSTCFKATNTRQKGLVQYASTDMSACADVSVLRGLLNPRLSTVIVQMLTQPEKNWQVASLAAVACMSRATFARHFKQITGQTPTKVLNLIRMNYASMALQRMEMPVVEIADKLGFVSQNGFHKAFVRHFRVTPNQYRRSVQQVAE